MATVCNDSLISAKFTGHTYLEIPKNSLGTSTNAVCELAFVLMGRKTIHLIVITPATDFATVAFILLPGQDLEVLNWFEESAL